MKSVRWMSCGFVVVALAACSGSDSDTESSVVVDDVVPTEVPEALAPPEPLPEADATGICPPAEAMSAATGLEVSLSAAFASDEDFLGFDVAQGLNDCVYTLPEASEMVLTLHNGPINTSFLLELPADTATVTELPSGLLQLQFVDQAGCEIYGDNVSVVLFTGSEEFDSCAVVGAALETAQA